MEEKQRYEQAVGGWEDKILTALNNGDLYQIRSLIEVASLDQLNARFRYVGIGGRSQGIVAQSGRQYTYDTYNLYFGNGSQSNCKKYERAEYDREDEYQKHPYPNAFPPHLRSRHSLDGADLRALITLAQTLTPESKEVLSAVIEQQRDQSCLKGKM